MPPNQRSPNERPPNEKPATIDAYIDAAAPRVRETLLQMRTIIRAAAPKAVEGISYGVPYYKQKGSLVSFGAAKNHCGFYPMSGSVLYAFLDELRDYHTSKGTIRFPLGEPLPAELITRIVAMRIAENEAKQRCK